MADNDKKGMGIAEITGAAAAGTTAAYVTSAALAPGQFESITKEAVTAAKNAEKLFRENNPEPTFKNIASAEEGLKAAEEYTKNLGAFIEKETKVLVNKSYDLVNPLTRPVAVFKNASTPAKIGIGAVIAGTSVLAGIGVNAYRNRNKGSHVEQLENQRTETKNSINL